ncbi:hypothetical protein [Pedobacter cryoconitis]|uniref:Uncharacterized protein n=1 Tax=Pedobacter cryoconitis TaxID=188932 RepID=A0A327SU23_9SPHI|nr:hypothetical protein [Pedobacter cryoconitis]RAJ31835.1 hypothetical protein LY11_01992 [Pedobacter cryoconitis]
MIITIFFITNSCFALKPGRIQAACLSALEIKPLSLHHQFNKTQQEGVSNLNGDNSEHPTLVQQGLNKQSIACLQLFRLPEGKSVRNTPLKAYNGQTQFHYNFIYDFLYPNHVFW